MKNTTWVFLILFCLHLSLSAGNYFVSPAGNDNNPGTQALPFKTISKAASVMIAGDTCLIMQGIYREKIVPQNSGAPGQYITYKNFANDTVIICGSDILLNFSSYQGNILKVWAPDTILQLFVNGVQAPMGSWPNVNASTYYGTAVWNPVNAATTGGTVAFTGANFPQGYWNGGTCVILTGYKWVPHDGIIDSTSGTTVRCTTRSSPWSTNNAGYLGAGRGYITHHLSTLDTANEWHWQHDTLYYYLPAGLNIANVKIEGRTRMLGMDCSNKSYIAINNIHFYGAKPEFRDSDSCIMDGGSVFYPTPFFYYNSGWVRNLPTSYDLQTLANGWEAKGVLISGHDNTIRNCYITGSFGDGVSLGGTDNKVENCRIEDCDLINVDAGPVSAAGYNLKVYHSTLKNSGRCILIHRGARRMEIKYNDLSDAGLTTLDLGITYSFHTNGDSTEIAYNWAHDNHASGTSNMGIYLDNYDTGYVVHHNVVWNCKNAFQTNKPAVNHQIYNNTAWGCTNAMGTWGNTGTAIVNQRLYNNLSDKAWSYYTYAGNNLVSAAPLFVDATNHDYHLQAGSPAIDYGVAIPPFTDGFAGGAPDAGAYEYGGTDWVPGSTVTKPDLSSFFLPALVPGIKDLNEITRLNLYPNPASDKINFDYALSAKAGGLTISIYNALGIKLADIKGLADGPGDHRYTFDTGGLSKGVYLCVMKSGRSILSRSFLVVR